MFFGKDLVRQRGAPQEVKEFVEIVEVKLVGDESVIPQNNDRVTVIAKKINIKTNKALPLAFYQSEVSTSPQSMGHGSYLVAWGFGNEFFQVENDTKIVVEALWSSKDKERNYLSTASSSNANLGDLIGSSIILPTPAISDRYTQDYLLSSAAEQIADEKVIFSIKMRRRSTAAFRLRQICRRHLPVPHQASGFLVPPSLGRKKHDLSEAFDSSATDATSGGDRDIDAKYDHGSSDTLNEEHDLPFPNSLLSIGNVQVVVCHGRKMSTNSPIFLTIDLPGNYCGRQKSPTCQNPHSPIFDFHADFDVFSIQSDVSIIVWEATAVSNVILGRVVIPLTVFRDVLLMDEGNNNNEKNIDSEAGKAKSLLRKYGIENTIRWFRPSGESNNRAMSIHRTEKRRSSAWEITSNFITGGPDSLRTKEASSAFTSGAAGATVAAAATTFVSSSTPTPSSGTTPASDATSSLSSSFEKRAPTIVREDDGSLTLRHWFEVLQRPSRKHRGGQYRPADSKLPLYSGQGYGIAKFDPPLGFLNIKLTLKVNKGLSKSILDNPWSYGPCAFKEEKEEDSGVWDMVVAANALMRIYKLTTDSPIIRFTNDIIHLRSPPVLCIIVFYIISYSLLAAPFWQVPFYAFGIVLLVGLCTGASLKEEPVEMYSNQKNVDDGDLNDGMDKKDADKFNNISKDNINGSNDEEKIKKQHAAIRMRRNGLADPDSAPVDETGNNEISNYENYAAEDEEELTEDKEIRDKKKMAKLAQNIAKNPNAGFFDGYKIFKSNAHRMQVTTNATRSLLERIMNIIIWKDYISSSTAALAMLFMAIMLSLTLCVITPRQILFGMMVGVFTDEIQVPFADTNDFFCKLLLHFGTGASLYKDSDIERILTRGGDISRYTYQEKSAAKRIGDTRGIYSMSRALMFLWLDVVPDDLDLQHREICQQALVLHSEENSRLLTKKHPIGWEMNEIVFAEFWKAGSQIDTKSTDKGEKHAKITYNRLVGSSLRFDKRLSASQSQHLQQPLHEKQKFIVKVNVISASNLNVTSQSSLVFVRQKIYVDLAIMPLGCSKYTCRSGGQLRSPNIVFREEFTFNDVYSTAESVVVAISCKAPTQLRAQEHVLAYAVVPFKDYLQACEQEAKQINGPMNFREVTATHRLLDANWRPTSGKVIIAMLLEYDK